ncbi:hypothetical protein DCPSUM001_18360 [Dysgonomonas capnocytophagoides]|nr:hypothetical protein DCPSUM001_18360 [Dysgonomonas capnocytophagoides]
MYIGIHKSGIDIGISDIDGDMLNVKNNIMPSGMGLFDGVAESIPLFGLS